MKNYMKYITAIIFALISSQSFAYDPNDSFDVARGKLLKTDCSVNLQECRYYAAVEYVAFAKGCGIALMYKNRGTEKDLKEFDYLVNAWIENWKAIEEPQMHKSVLSKNNPFKEKITKDVIDYLKGSPIDDVSIECSRIQSIKEQENPEEVSDLITTTVNYQQWYAPIHEKKQKEFNENQERLRKENK